MAWGEPTEPWFATGVGMSLGGLGSLAVQWQTSATAPLPGEPFWNWLSYLGAILIFSGSFLALANAGIPIRTGTEAVRSWVPTRRDPEHFTPAPPDEARHLVALLPWFTDGQIQLRLVRGTPTEAHIPKGPVVCEVRTADGALVAASHHIGQQHANWLTDAYFPRDFPDAPRHLSVGGVYQVVWIVLVPVMQVGAGWDLRPVEADRLRFRVESAERVWLP